MEPELRAEDARRCVDASLQETTQRVEQIAQHVGGLAPGGEQLTRVCDQIRLRVDEIVREHRRVQDILEGPRSDFRGMTDNFFTSVHRRLDAIEERQARTKKRVAGMEGRVSVLERDRSRRRRPPRST